MQICCSRGRTAACSPGRSSGGPGGPRARKSSPPEEFASPLGKRVYDLRHTCPTTWLNNGVPPAQVAEWAGNSVPVLLAIYAWRIVGHLSDLKKRIEAGGTYRICRSVERGSGNATVYPPWPPAETR